MGLGLAGTYFSIAKSCFLYLELTLVCIAIRFPVLSLMLPSLIQLGMAGKSPFLQNPQNQLDTTGDPKTVT